MLRKIRLTFAVLFLLGVTSLFLDFTGSLHAWLGWMAKIQFLPAVLALNVGVILILVILTLVLGRVYCSVICPLGVMQDVISWLSGQRKKKKIPLFLFSGKENIEVWLAGRFCHRNNCWSQFICRLVGPIQFLWPNGAESLFATLPMGEQSACLFCGES